ncbi:MAG: transposase, partial [Proteobacteria bacterium]|nr:transposase [Pseudomonadota bacterium]
QAARQRAAQEREERIRAALEQLPQVQAAKRRNGDKPEDARASTTDADARVMKMGDGGFRPAFNVQMATTCEDQVIVGVDVSNAGSDMAQMAPMVEQVIQRTGSTPGQWLVDGGFPAHEQIDAVHEHSQGQTEVIAPVPEPRRKPGDDDGAPADKHQRKQGDSEPVAQWRARMADDEVKQQYKQRAATAECVNALARNRGLQRMPVRGLIKARAVAYLYALAHNLMRMVKIAPQLIAAGTGASAVAAAAA